MTNARASLRTLCLVQQGGRVLLGFKKRGFGAGKWNGFGGKVHVGESLAEAAVRELHEEAGIAAAKLEPRGELVFRFENELPPLAVHVFVAREYRGQPHETEEMRPQWFSIADIPYEAMWADDRHWLPQVLAGRAVRGEFVFADEATLLAAQVKEIATASDLRHIEEKAASAYELE